MKEGDKVWFIRAEDTERRMVTSGIVVRITEGHSTLVSIRFSEGRISHRADGDIAYRSLDEVSADRSVVSALLRARIEGEKADLMDQIRELDEELSHIPDSTP